MFINPVTRRRVLAVAAASGFIIPVWTSASHGDELPFKATTLIIELTDNDIELQFFIDGDEWSRLRMFDPKGRGILDLRTRHRLGAQGGTELHHASQPSHFPEDDFGEIDPIGVIETVEAFLEQFPAGGYDFEALSPEGVLDGEATLTHVLPALPEIVAPVSLTSPLTKSGVSDSV